MAVSALDLISMVDALLAEHNRPLGSGRRASAAGGLGRRLQDAIPPSCDAVDAAVAWMESRIDALAADVAAAPSSEQPGPGVRAGVAPRRSARGGVGTRHDDGGDSIGELARLEREAKEMGARVQCDRGRVAALRKQLDAAGVASCVAATERAPGATSNRAPPAAPASLAAVVVRPGRGGAAGTSIAELREAAARRAVALRRALPGVRAEAVSLARERTELEHELRVAGVPVEVEGLTRDDDDAPCASSGLADPDGEPGGSPHPLALLAQLRRLDEAVAEGRASGNADAAAARDGGASDRPAAPLGGAAAAARRNIHQLRDAAAPIVPVTVFRDGFMLYRGPFRPFGTDAADLFARQAMAGFWPHELQQSYPDGCRMQLHDCCGHTHAAAHAEALAQHSVRARSGVVGLADVAEGANALLAPQGAEQLLRRLPASVVRSGGSVVPVRDELAALLGKGGVGHRGHGPHQAPPPSEAGLTAMPHDPQHVRAARLRRFEARP